jgi:hypothetical protein
MDKREVYALSNMHIPHAEDNFMEGGKAVKPLINKDYASTIHMGYADLSDEMAHGYTISKRTCNWTQKVFFYLSDLLDLTILNSYTAYKSWGWGNTTASEIQAADQRSRCSSPRRVQ